jgi:2-methylisocitrate lyase-like PEP mutase family enzyme
MDQAELGKRFEELHQGAPFVIPNPWDAGTARVLESLGFEALATTSSAFAYTLGRLDGQVTLDEVVDHVRRLTEATELPLSVDLENGFGAAPEQAALAIEAVAAVGAVGGSIEDWDGDEERLYEPAEAAERIAAAAEVTARLPFRFMLTARAENHLRGNPDLDDTIARLRAYEEAGADVVFAPGLRELDDIAAVAAATERPLNVLGTPSQTVEGIAGAGAQRISVGGSLAWATVEAMAEIAVRLRDDGDLGVLRPPGRVRRWLGGE